MEEKIKDIPRRNNSSLDNSKQEFKSITNQVSFVSLLQAALYWAGKGYNIIPIKRLGSTPATANPPGPPTPAGSWAPGSGPDVFEPGHPGGRPTHLGVDHLHRPV